MKPMARASFWLAGPSIAIALLAGLLAIGGGGPGLFFLVLLASGLFLVAMPLLQWGLLALHAFDGRRMAITLAAFLALAAVVVVMGASGLFSFW